MKDKKNMAMIIIVGIILFLFLCVNSKVFATTGTVVGSNIRVRKEESTTSEIIDLLGENDKVEILGENGDWYKVKANGKIGYVTKQFVKVENQANNTVTNTESNQPAENTQNTESNTTEQAQNTESAEKSEEQQNETAENTQTAQASEEKKEEPKSVKFQSDAELKVVPLITGSVIGTTSGSEVYEVVNKAGAWSYVKSGNKYGWTLTEKATVIENSAPASQETNNEAQAQNQEEAKPEKSETEKLYSKSKTYYVKGSSVNARKSASKTSDVVKVLNTNNEVKVIGEDDSWYIIEIKGDRAYVSKSLLSKEKIEVTSRSSNSVDEGNGQAEEARSSVPSSPIGANVVAYAMTFKGYRYVYGTNGPNTFDCSGFVQYVYKHFGYNLSRSSSTQANDGVAVSKSDLQPGDVLIFRDTSNSRIGHVGLYIGGGEFIHASNSRTGVIVSSLSTSAYQKRYVGARRIL